MRRLSSMYQDPDSYGKVMELGPNVFKTSKRVLGPQHRDTLDAMAHLAELPHAADQRQSKSDLIELCAE